MIIKCVHLLKGVLVTVDKVNGLPFGSISA